MQKFTRVVRDLGLLEGRTPMNGVVLRSLPGCDVQSFHADYNPEEPCFQPGSPLTKPLGILMALTDGAKLYIRDRLGHVYTIHLNAGDILVFDGDAIHAGADYDEENVRLHMYADVPEVIRKKDTTYSVETP